MTDDDDLTRRIYGARGYEHPLPPSASAALRARDSRVGEVTLDTIPREYRDPILDHPELRAYTPVLAYYPVSLTLGVDVGNRVTEGVGLRPEPFVLRRITYATTGDINTGSEILDAFPLTAGSEQARMVQVTWGDEFTRFLGPDAALVASIFADSQGFLDVPGLALFQGSQQLNVTLERLIVHTLEPFVNVITTWDFLFAGFGLLPKGVNQSGAVG